MGLPEVPGTEFFRQKRLQSRSLTMKRTAESAGTSPSTDTLNLPGHIVTPPDYPSVGDHGQGQGQEQANGHGHGHGNQYQGPSGFHPGLEGPPYSTGFTPGLMEMGAGGMSMSFPMPMQGGASYNDEYAAQYSQQNLMATAMSLSMDPGSGPDYGLGAGGAGGDYGLGFDVSNFSFDIGDFSTLLGMPGQVQGEQNKNGGNGAYGT